MKKKSVSRRDFLTTMAGLTAGTALACSGAVDSSDAGLGSDGEEDGLAADGSSGDEEITDTPAKVYIVKTDNRLDGISAITSMCGLGFATGKNVVLKPNFNSANAFPASTHDDCLRGVVAALKNAEADQITLAESSGPAGTQKVIEAKGTLDLCAELNMDFVDFDEMPAADWELASFDGITWPGGLRIPKIMRGDQAVVLLPCCKTHEYGGHFTLSLKLGVGLVPKSRRNEMHTGNIRQLIADINGCFTPDLVIMDAMSCFITGGPDHGTVKHPNLLLASTDRIAIDAVAVAVLAAAGSDLLQDKKIFEQDQIARAVSIGLGASSPDQIELVGDDQSVISELRGILDS